MRFRHYHLFRYLFICINIGSIIILISYITGFNLSDFDLFNFENSYNIEDDENHPFHIAIQRLLHTHRIAYENLTKCESKGKLNEKETQILNNVTRLIPEMQSQIIPYPHRYFKGRGIVLTVGRDQLLHTKFNLRIIQWLKTKLPVEVWYSSEQINNDTVNDILDYVPKLKLKLCSFETSCCRSFNREEINLPNKYTHISRTKNIHGKKYSFKLASIVSSTFAEIIFIDSDCYIVRDPTYIFEKDPMYIKFGALLYPDIYLSHQRSEVLSVFNTTCVKNEYSIDSGVLVFDKKRVWKGLYMAKLMGDYHQFFYDYFISHGDKDTFRLAFRYMKIPYYIVGIPCSTGYVINRTFCGVTLCKTDSLGLNVYFDHVHHPKHMHDQTFLKRNFTHTMIALADPNTERFHTGYCGLYPLPCFQVGIINQKVDISFGKYCETSGLIHTERPLIEISSGQTILWNPNIETNLTLMKKTNISMPGFIDFYFLTQNESIYKNYKL